MPRFRETVPMDDYVLDVLMRDLVGHDHQPGAFLVYLYLYRQAKMETDSGQPSYDCRGHRSFKEHGANCSRKTARPSVDRVHQGLLDRGSAAPGSAALARAGAPMLRISC